MGVIEYEQKSSISEEVIRPCSGVCTMNSTKRTETVRMTDAMSGMWAYGKHSSFGLFSYSDFSFQL
jgi:hypothetical protein